MGNPHAVQVVADVETRRSLQQGPLIEHHARFPQRVNAGFMQIVSTAAHIRLRVFERGAGETLACGTGACAAVVAGIRRGLLDAPVDVETHGGRADHRVGRQRDRRRVLMAGPADHRLRRRDRAVRRRHDSHERRRHEPGITEDEIADYLREHARLLRAPRRAARHASS